MSNWDQHVDRDGMLRPWPWEDEAVSAEEFERSLQSLKHFVELVDIYQLSTLEDLSSVASLIGHDLRTVAAAKGRKMELKTEQVVPGTGEAIPAVAGAFVLTRVLLDREIIVTASDGHSSLSEKKRIGFQGVLREELRVRLPSDRDIAIGNAPNVEERSIYAIDVREGRLREYYPAREPSDFEIQRAFAAVLKDAVRDLIEMLPS